MADYLFLHEEQLHDINQNIDGVREVAQSASATAGNAVERANNAVTYAQSAQATAQNAQQRSQNAEELARTAGAKADNAQSTANSAKSIAQSAEAKADEAKTTAQSANTTAQQAKTTADSAKTDAIQALQGLATKANVTDLPTLATDDVAGLVKLNTFKDISLDDEGQLVIGGRIGQFKGTTGLFAPDNREPRGVGDYSLLMTDALGVNMPASRSMAVVSGFAITVQSAEPNTTVYYAENNYLNRILAKVCENGVVSRDEETSKVEMTIPVVSVLIDGQPFEPDSSPPDPDKPIEITLEETANPDTTITQLRMFGILGGYASEYIGNGIRSSGGGRTFLLGGGLVKINGNDHCLVGQQMYVNGNGNVMFGRRHIATKNRGFFHGTGHDGRNAKSESVAAFGDWSEITNKTALCYGNGTSETDRKNMFELRTDGRLKISGSPTENNDVVTKGFADTTYADGSVTVYGNASFTYEQVIDPETGTVINECVAYSTTAGNANEPTATKYGRMVNLAGAFKNINVRPDNSAFDMGKVPVGCEPLKTQYILSQGTSQYKFMLTIRTDGTINCSRYSSGASAVAVPNNAWLNINATYVSKN